MTIQEQLISKANENSFDVKCEGLTVEFKLKKYKLAWNKYVYTDRGPFIRCLSALAQNKTPTYI